MNAFLSASTLKLVVPIVLSLLVALGIAGTYLHTSGYKKGYKIAVTECEASKASRNQAVVERIAELVEAAVLEREELKRANQALSEKLEERQKVIIKEVDRVIKEQPIVVNPDCTLEYAGSVGLLNEVATSGTTRSNQPPAD